MIKIFNFKKNNNLRKLEGFLDKRRSGKNGDTSIVKKILAEVKKDKLIAVLKYEKKFSNNNKIYPSKLEIRKSIKSLDVNLKKAIDVAFDRILRFHKLQKNKNIKYIDKYKNKIEQIGRAHV